MSYLVLIDHLTLLHFFHRYYLAGGLDSADSNFTESTSTNNGKWLEIAHRNFLSPKVI